MSVCSSEFEDVDVFGDSEIKFVVARKYQPCKNFVGCETVRWVYDRTAKSVRVPRGRLKVKSLSTS